MNLPQSHGVTEINSLTQRIIGCAIEVHRALGPGLLLNFNSRLMKDGIARLIL